MKSTLLALLLLLLCPFAFAQKADLILVNGTIFTSDTAQLYAQAIAIRGERILAVGTTEAITRMAGPATRRIDLGGRLVIPGINDAHDHIGYGAPVSRYIAFQEPMLPGPTLQQVLDSVRIAASQTPKGTVIESTLGLRIIEDREARRAALDAVSPDHPVILHAPWGHGTLLNTKALRLVGIGDEDPDPVGGMYEREQGSRRLSGFLSEYGEFGILRQWHAQLPEQVMVQVFRTYSDAALRMGITSVQNMSTALNLQQAVNVLRATRSPLRIRVIRFPGTTPKGRQTAAWSKSFPATPQLEVNGMKWILDGTPLERGALMRAAYTDQPGTFGRLNFPVDTLRRILREAAGSREQLLLHIVGDSTPILALQAMKAAGPEQSWKAKRVRFEHADGLTPDLYPEARRLGIVAVVNPVHFTFAEVNNQRVGARTAHYQPFRSLIEAGIPVAIGSDGPNNPFLNIMFAAMHPTNPSEAVTREQALIAYTYGSAYAEQKEKSKGRLKPGMLADLAVLSQNIFTVPLEALPGTGSVLTLVGGKVAFDAGVLK